MTPSNAVLLTDDGFDRWDQLALSAGFSSRLPANWTSDQLLDQASSGRRRSPRRHSHEAPRIMEADSSIYAQRVGTHRTAKAAPSALCAEGGGRTTNCMPDIALNARRVE